MTIEFEVNSDKVSVDTDPQMPLLWFIRDELRLTGTKFGCGIAQCGACTVHVDGAATRSCVTPLIAVEGSKVTTIEGLKSTAGTAAKDAWERLEVAQCGYCQSGQIMSALDLLQTNTNPSDADIEVAMNGNICRCATYGRIRQAIKDAAKNLKALENG